MDRPLAHVWAGEDVHAGLKDTFRAVHNRVRDRRRELDRAFAERLAAWTSAGTPPGDLRTVETLLTRVVAPLVRQSIFNVDNYPVASVIDEGRTVRLDLTLLQQQFGIRKDGSMTAPANASASPK
ncbi:hypothetical protein [Phytohabitans rumicis]|uniref:Alkaline phosphatase-like protein PglZ C-terminal domain-containing protein n=1 Tax=Phytohabitans rumicis TaxID=1076125 RepID=A0A6V8LAM9_9ACTN|nr:hypothetical protein [Phytohabitans rumicis]GFJ93404.1 hypothetical protein Prum_070460 [Phytohabitans rumicis]